MTDHRETPKFHREKALAKVRAAVADAQSATAEAEAWLRSIGAEPSFLERAKDARDQLDRLAGLLSVGNDDD